MAYNTAKSNKVNGLRHYEIVFLINPDQEDQLANMTERFRKIITDNKGAIHRFENRGKRPLAYLINDLQKAYYILMNVEASVEAIVELETAFKFNDSVIRNLIISKKRPITELSEIMKAKEKDERRAAYYASQSERYPVASPESADPAGISADIPDVAGEDNIA